MSRNGPLHCDFCKHGRVAWNDRRVAFRQWTDRGHVSCSVAIPLGVCDRCRCGHWSADAETIVEDAVRRAYEKLAAAA